MATQPETAVQEEKKDETPKFETQDELVKAMQANPELNQEFIDATREDKVDDFIAKYRKPESEEEEPAEDPGAKPEPKAKPKAKADPDQPDEKLTIDKITVKKKDLGTYLKNRKPGEAIHELIKGKRSADKKLDWYKTDHVPTIERERDEAVGENATLREQLAVYEAKKKEPEKPEAKKDEKPPEKIELPKELEKGDFLDPDYQEKVRDYIISTGKANTALLERLVSQDVTIGELKSLVTDNSKKTDEAIKAVQSDDGVAVDEKQIERMRKRNDDIFVSVRAEEDINTDYREFLERLRDKAGVKEPVFVNGKLSAGIVGAYHQYHAQDEAGKALHDKCEADEIRPPEDLGDLGLIQKVRAVRETDGRLNKRTGKYEPIPYEEALQRVLGTVDLSKIRRKAAVAGQGKLEDALQKRSTKAKEVKPGEGADPEDITGVTLDDFKTMHAKYMASLKKGKAKPEDRIMLETIMKAKGLKPEAIKSLLTLTGE